MAPALQFPIQFRQQDVRQQRTQGAALRRALRPRGDGPLCHHARFEIPADEAQHSPVVDLQGKFLHQQVVIDPVEEFLQVPCPPPPGGLRLSCAPAALASACGSSRQPRHRARPPRSSAPILLRRHSLAVSLLPTLTAHVFPPPTRGLPCSALRLAPTMASADFCTGVPTPLDAGSTKVALGTCADLPGYDAPTFTVMPVGSTSRRCVQVSGFADIGLLTPPCRLVSAPL